MITALGNKGLEQPLQSIGKDGLVRRVDRVRSRWVENLNTAANLVGTDLAPPNVPNIREEFVSVALVKELPHHLVYFHLFTSDINHTDSFRFILRAWLDNEQVYEQRLGWRGATALTSEALVDARPVASDDIAESLRLTHTLGISGNEVQAIVSPFTLNLTADKLAIKLESIRNASGVEFQPWLGVRSRNFLTA